VRGIRRSLGRRQRGRFVWPCLRFVFLLGLIAVRSPEGHAAQERDSALLDERTQAELVFHGNGILKSTRVPGPSEEQALELLRGEALSLLDSLGSGLATFLAEAPVASAPAQPIGPDDFKAIRERWARLPFRVCLESCPCRAEGSLACSFSAGSRVRESFQASLLLVDPCVLGAESSARCGEHRKKLRVAAGSLGLEAARGLAAGFVEAGLVQLWSYETIRSNRKLTARAFDLVRRASQKLDTLARSCPGPYPRTAQAYLETIGALEELPSVWTDCAQRMVEPFRKPEVQAACSRAASAALWEKWITRGILTRPLGARRCQGVCELGTGCFGPDSPETPRPLGFGADWYLSLPPGTCEGKLPLRADAFYEVLVARFLSPSASADARASCLSAIKRAAAQTPAAPELQSFGEKPASGRSLPTSSGDLELPESF